MAGLIAVRAGHGAAFLFLAAMPETEPGRAGRTALPGAARPAPL